MKRILVPCDFSAPAVEAFRFAINIAQQSKGEVYVLYIIDITFMRGNPSLAQMYAFNLNFLRDIEREVNDKFQKMWEKYSPLTLPVKFEHRIGSLVSEIKSETDKKNIDLIVLGTHSESERTFGSNAEKIIRNASVPVFALRKLPGKQISDIVLPVAISPPGEKFMEQIKKLQAFFSATLHLIWINTPAKFKTDSEALTDVQLYAKELHLEKYTINIRSDYFVENGILQFAKEINAQVIAMGTHHRKGVAHLFFGSVAEDVLDHANLPLWTFSLQ